MRNPTKLELRLLVWAEQDLITDTEVARRLNLKHRHTAGLRMWRVHKWKVAHRRANRMKQ